MSESAPILTTTAAVIDALGGVTAVAAMTGRKYTAAHNWRSFDTFPSNTYVAMTRELARRGLSAPDSLWGMAGPSASADPEPVIAEDA